MVLGRRKTPGSAKPRKAVVPTEPPVFSTLERLGVVVVMSERKSPPPARAPRAPRPGRRPR